MDRNSMIPEKYRSDVHKALIAVAAIGPIGLLGDLDAVAVTAAWSGLLTAMFMDANAHLDKETAKKLTLAVLAAAGGYYAGCKLATKLFLLVPGAGLIIGAGASAIANVVFTYRFAWVIAKMLEEDRISSKNILGISGDVAKMMTMGGGITLSGVRDIVALYRNK